ncbi:multiheme c-type cytochrome [Schlesneria paludicola]|uniref:multiheme c-type cytochrome n=1 Tax=Schlesneria paludicola TaxID=360056 RepID=UPI0012FBC8DF|nr:multiheme c-type cytochrome [Schlesneria paludicola]
MANSSAIVSHATPLEDFDHNSSFVVSTHVGDVEYRVEKTLEGVFHHESLTDAELGSIYDQRVRVDYVIGSGRHGRSYVSEQGDCLFMSPITWYSGESNWGLSPNYRPGNNPRFERRIVLACLVCHAERVSVDRDAPNHFSSPAIQEGRIGCESCHGPGAGHVEFHQQRVQTPQQLTVSDSIVNPAKLDPVRRESVCWQCHFAAEERIPRFEKLDSDFRAGDRFDDIWVAFVRGLRLGEDGSMRVASHVEQTQVSVCSQRSGGRFGCLSCHDPHSVPSETERETFYRAKCMNCHSDRGCTLSLSERTRQNSDSCIGCHMPSHKLSRIPHTSSTDHRILRHPEPELPPKHDQLLTIFRPDDRKLPPVEEDRAWGLVLAKFAYLQQDVEIARVAKDKLSAVQPRVPGDNRVLEWLGVCEELLHRPEVSRDYWLQILKSAPKDEGALHRLAELSITQGQPLQIKQALTSYLNVNRWQSSYQLRLAAASGHLGQLDEAARYAVEALRINPTLATAHQILAEVYRRQGMAEHARRHQQVSKRLESAP